MFSTELVSNTGSLCLEQVVYNEKTIGLDVSGMLDAISQIPEGHTILLHPSAHNPTGVDPTKEDWEKIEEVVAKRKLFLMSVKI